MNDQNGTQGQTAGFADGAAQTQFASDVPGGITAIEIRDTFRSHWKQGYGSVTGAEAMFIQMQIARHRPKHFLEVGMASGLSGGLIAQFLDRFGGEKFTTLDHDNTFFGDTSKPNGFLIEAIYGGSAVKVAKRPFTTALDLDDLGENYDMAFIDANHQHPWPLIDTLCLYPYLGGSRIVIHHDLELFRKQKIVFGIGPKYLYDQFPSSRKRASTLDSGNIFMLDLNMPKAELEKIAMDGFSLPWSLRTQLQDNYIEQTRAMMKRHYSPALLTVFNDCLERFNVVDRFRSGL